MDYMQGHKIPNVKKSICVKEQLAAYEVASQIYTNVVYPVFNKNYPFSTGIIKVDFESWLKEKIFIWCRNIANTNVKVQKLNTDLIIHCCFNGIMKELYDGKEYISTCYGYNEVGNIYNTLYTQIDK